MLLLYNTGSVTDGVTLDTERRDVHIRRSLYEHSTNLSKFFNVQRSVHRQYTPFDIFPTICNITYFIYFWKTALHVSGGISTHHQEHTQLYLQHLVLVKPLLLPAAIVEVLELV